MTDPLADSVWSRPETVAGFAHSPPNADLVRVADEELRRTGRPLALDIGCGAGRNAIPLAQQGWTVLGTDLSLPMLRAAREDARAGRVGARFQPLLSPMHHLPVRDRSCRLVIAHGIWNLARTGAEFRQAVREAGRVATTEAVLFLFTFSRGTLPPEARPVSGEAFVFTAFSGEPQCFLSEEQIVAEMGAAGFAPDAALPLRELNRRPPGTIAAGGPPVIYQGTFRRVG